MADTTTQTTAPSVKKYYDYAQQQIDEQAILDKYNAATVAQYNVQREQNRQAENQFYNQMYNTQRTAMDTIRKANAAAVSSGASRGVQAANELSALLGLEQESVASATELAQANRQTAQEETAAVLENVLNAYQQAQQERSQLVSQGIEAASIDAQESANEIAAMEAQTNRMNAETQQTQTQLDLAKLSAEAANNGTQVYLNALQKAGVDYSTGEVTPDSINSLNTALSAITKDAGGNFEANDWAGSKSGANKANIIVSDLEAICDAYGLDKSAYKEQLDALQKLASYKDVSFWGYAGYDKAATKKLNVSLDIFTHAAKTDYAAAVQQGYQNILARIRNDYTSGNNRITKSK